MTVRELLAPLAPGRRRWERFLAGLPLDPARLPRPLAPPGERDVILCGSPRTGTTLLCAALFQPPRIVTVMEPWDGMRLPPAPLFRSLREEIAATGQLRRGRLDVAGLVAEGRASWCTEGTSVTDLALDEDYLLAVKWPAYWHYLELLPDTRFVVCLRHPLEVVASYKQAGGRVAKGLQYKTAFNRELNEELRAATRDTALRRVLLYDYVNSRLLPHLDRANVFVVRYERWFTDAEALRAELGDFLGTRVEAGHVRIRPPRSGSRLTPQEVALVRDHCQTAAVLGYDLADDVALASSPGRTA